ncbi:hypothetical protein [Krasilnikovia sp. MM14-A1004]|uniref:hypothetical protein n=1 Tax=Krasilnikovia sp. MM14-A1004 TaxID=3373541 RepID=UPI00399C8FBE
MNPWRRTRVELAGVWRSVGYDLRRWLTPRRPGTGGAHRAGGPVTSRRIAVVSAFGLVVAAGAGGGYLALSGGATPSRTPAGAPPYPVTADGPTGGGAQAGGPEPDGATAARAGLVSDSPQPSPTPPMQPGRADGEGAGADPAALRGRFDPPRRDRPAPPTRTTGAPGRPATMPPPAPAPVPPPTPSPRPSGPVSTPPPPSYPVTSYTTAPPSAQPSGSAVGETPPIGKPPRPHRPHR